MNDEPVSRRQRPSSSKDTRTSHGQRSSMIWVAGAAAIALLAGGGYYAWKYGGLNQPASEIAKGADLTWTEGAKIATKEAPIANDLSMPSADADERDSKKLPKARVASAQIPEETIGVSHGAFNPPQDNDVVVNARRPVWRRMPSAERLSEYYPAVALERGREGEASLRCAIKEHGVLKCVRVSETPTHAGFGAAAVRVARTFRHAPLRADGRDAVGTSINLRVLFRMSDGERRG